MELQPVSSRPSTNSTGKTHLRHRCCSPSDISIHSAACSHALEDPVWDRNMAESSVSRFTCGSCAIGFYSPDAQRRHFRSDLHTYNLKRKVADLRPVSAQEFAEKVLAVQNESKVEQAKAKFEKICAVCDKSYFSENSYTNHLQSKRHRDCVVMKEQRERKVKSPSDSMLSTFTFGDGDTEMKTETEQVGADATIEDDPEAEIEDRIKMSRSLESEDCLFCSLTSVSFEANVAHMSFLHSFFIPEREYLIDLPGLIKYLGQKLSIGHCCIACNSDKWRSLQAVRAHMQDRCHCKVAYSLQDDKLELSEYYDFSPSYSTPGLISAGEDANEASEDEAGWETDSEASSLASENMGALHEDGYELTLANGSRIGHRGLARYYRQNLRHVPIVPIPRVRAITQYGEKMKAADQQVRGRLRFEESRRREEFTTRMAFKNNHQKHYRDPLLQ